MSGSSESLKKSWETRRKLGIVPKGWKMSDEAKKNVHEGNKKGWETRRKNGNANLHDAIKLGWANRRLKGNDHLLKLTIDKDGPILTNENAKVQIAKYPEIENTHCWILSSDSACSVHRFSKMMWEQKYNEKVEKDGQNICLCHKCDKILGPCVNPDHLVKANAYFNVHDMIDKNRHRWRNDD